VACLPFAILFLAGCRPVVAGLGGVELLMTPEEVEEAEAQKRLRDMVRELSKALSKSETVSLPRKESGVMVLYHYATERNAMLIRILGRIETKSGIVYLTDNPDLTGEEAGRVLSLPGKEARVALFSVTFDRSLLNVLVFGPVRIITWELPIMFTGGVEYLTPSPTHAELTVEYVRPVPWSRLGE